MCLQNDQKSHLTTINWFKNFFGYSVKTSLVTQFCGTYQNLTGVGLVLT